jgi:hypothetical protein
MAVTKVFEIKLTGGKEVGKNILDLKKAITQMGTVISTTKNELQKLLSVKGDNTQITELSKKLDALNRSYEALKRQKASAETDVKREKALAKELTDQKIREAKEREANAKAIKAEEAARKTKIQADQQEEQQARRNKSAQDALAGSYNATYSAYRALYNLVKSTPKGQAISFQGQLLGFDQAIAKLKQLSSAEQAFRRQFSRDGLLVGEYTSGIVQAFKQLNIDDILRRQVTGAKEELNALQKRTEALIVAFKQAQSSGSADMNKLEKEIHDNVIEMQSLRGAVQQADAQLKGIGGIGSQITAGINSGVKQLKTSIAQFALTYFGFQALFSAVQSGVGNAKELSDQTSDLEINLDKAAGGADDLVKALSKLQTRTKLTVLEDIANTALRAGVAEENLLGVTKAIDIIKTAFGSDFGDIESGTETLVKIINIFFEDGQVTEDRILKIGNAIRKLANETVASVPFINDFTGRMAGVKQIANVTLSDIIGLGAGFEEFKQSAEVSSTVLVKVIPKMAKDLSTFAKIAGLTNEQFKTLLQDTPIEALLRVSEGLVAGKGDIEVFADALKDAGLDAGRATTIIATLGGKADVFRSRIALAAKSIEETGAITDAFNRKNTNLAATLDKVGKKFADAANTKAFQAAISAVASVILLLLNNIPALITILGILAGSWAIQNVQLLALRGSIIAYNILIARNAILIGILTPIIRAYNGVIFILTGAYNLAARAAAFFGIASRAAVGPLGVVLAVVSVLGSALVGLSRTMANTNTALKEQSRNFILLKGIQREAALAIADTQAKMAGYVAIVKDTTLSEQTRLKAMQDLIAIDPAFSKALQGNTIDLTALNNILKDVNLNLQQKAELEAAQNLQKNSFNEVVRLKTLKESLQVAKTLKQGFADLSDEQKALFGNKTTTGRIAFTADVLNLKIPKSDFDVVFKDIDNQIATENKKLDGATDLLKNKYKTVTDEVNKGKAGLKDASKSTTEPVEVDIAKLKADIKELDDQIKNFRGSQVALTVLVKKRKELQQQLDTLLEKGKKKSDRGSRLTGDQKDLFKDIEALRDEQLAINRKKFIDLTIDEKTYLKTQLKINTDANDKKIKLLKGVTAEERRIIAELNLQKITDAKETNQKLFDIDNKALEIRLRNRELAAQIQLDAQLENPNLTNQAKLKLQEDFYNQMLLDRIVFNQQQIALEKFYGVSSIENEQKRLEAIQAIQKKLNEIKLQTPEAQIKDIRDAGDKQINEFNAFYARLRKAILENTNITDKERKRQLDALDRSQRKTILSAELAQLTIEFKKAEELYKQGRISEAQYLDAKRKMEEKAAQNAESIFKPLDTFEQGIQGLIDNISNLFKTGDLFQKEIGDSGISFGFVIAQGFDIAKDALNGYYEAKRSFIEKEKQDHLDALDRERERVLARAESAAEEDTINREFAQKKRKVEKEAGEKLKKQKIAEAKLSLVTEIAAIAASAASNPANAFTFGAAGLAQFAILSALALTRYAFNVAAINHQQFAKGGRVGYLGSGKIVAQSNIPQQKNGDNIVATVKRGEVILNEKHQKLLGGPEVFKRIGVPGFASGGLITAPQLGTTLVPPQFTSGFYSSGVNNQNNTSADNTELKNLIGHVAQLVLASDKKDVMLNPNNVTKAQNRTRRDVKLGEI